MVLQDKIVKILKLKCKSRFVCRMGFIGIFLFFSNSCKKDEMPHYIIPTALFAYSDFQKDSYWIYSNNETHAIDCTFISGKVVETINSDQGPVHPNQYDRLTITFSSQVYTFFRTFAYNGGGMMEVKYTDLSLGILDTWMFEDPNKYQNWYVVYYPAYNMNGTIYSDVYQSRTNKIVGNETISTDTFLAKNYGIIRVITKTNQDTTFNWSLIRYKIIQ